MTLNLWAAQLSGAYFVAEGETPTPRPSINPDDVSPGIESFIIVFLLALAIIFLVWSMSRHLRRVQVRSKLDEERRRAAARERSAETADGPAVTPDSDTPGPPDV